MPPTRRAFLAGTAAGLSAVAATPERPNLVYVFADQLRYQSCGYAGDEYARTPNIDRLAAQSCNFHQAISNTPVCAPYRASLLTGKCQSSTGMVINELRLSPAHDTLGRALTRGGYRTAYIGKLASLGKRTRPSRRNAQRFRSARTLSTRVRQLLGRVQFQSHLLQVAVLRERHHAPHPQSV